MLGVNSFLQTALNTANTGVDAGKGLDATAAARTSAGGYGSAQRISDDQYGALAYNLYGGAQLNGAQWGQVGGYNAGAKGQYNSTLDSNVGALDKQIQEAQSYQGTGAFDPTKLKALQTQRAVANVGRWASVTDWSNPGMQQLKQALSSGQISWKDLGEQFDISEMSNPSGLAQHLTQYLKDKAAAANPAGAAAPTALDTAQADATKSVGDSLNSINDYANSTLDTALGTFDEQVGQKGRQIESQSNPLARQIGGEDAGFQANVAGSNLAANASAQRDVVKDSALSNVNDFISSSLEKGIDQNTDLANMDTSQKLQIQQQGLKGLMTELQNHVDTSNAGAMEQLNQLQAQINDFNSQQMSDQERQSKIHSILGLASGLVLSGLGAAAAATGVGAAASPFLVAGGVGQIAKSV